MRKILARSTGAAALILVLLFLSMGHATVTASPAPAMEKAALAYLYQGAIQQNLNDTSVVGNMTVGQPYVKSTDYHSLMEFAVQSADSNQIVEVGWTVDRAGTNGTDYTYPHLFVGAWVNGVFKGYNGTTGSGWVDYAPTTLNAGDSLASYVGTAPSAGITYFGSAWWIWFDGAYIGYFPSSLWTGASPSVTTFTSIKLMQAFGEIAYNSTSFVPVTCTDMGAATTVAPIDGILPTAYGTPSNAAKIANVSFSTTATALVAKTAATPSYYNNYVSSTGKSVMLGGPGFGSGC